MPSKTLTKKQALEAAMLVKEISSLRSMVVKGFNKFLIINSIVKKILRLNVNLVDIVKECI